jgi:predicted DNA-binding transcriptional regulator AlpA
MSAVALYWRKGAVVLPDPMDRPVISAEEAFAELGIDRSTGYRAIREGTFPVPVLRIGRLIRVPVAPLRRLLQLGDAKLDEGDK